MLLFAHCAVLRCNLEQQPLKLTFCWMRKFLLYNFYNHFYWKIAMGRCVAGLSVELSWMMGGLSGSKFNDP